MVTQKLRAVRRLCLRAASVVSIVTLVQIGLIQALTEPDERPATAARAQVGDADQSNAPIVVAQAITQTPSVTTTPSPTSTTSTTAPTSAPTSDPRYFAETGFSVAAGPIYDFFRTHGGARVFGPPISNQFRLIGDPVQLFRFHALVQNPDGTISTVALLDIGAVPSNRVGGRVLPSYNDTLLDAAPAPDGANYSAEALSFIQQRVPDQWNGLPVGFHRFFQSTVTLPDIAPNTDSARLPAMALEVWGLPTSEPTADPQNPDRVYLRWENGVMEFDRGTGQVQAVPLGEAFKSVLTGQNLAAELAADAQSSPYFQQYSATAPNGVAKPDLLPDTVLSGAFQTNNQPSTAAAPPPQGNTVTGPATPTATGAAVAQADQCLGDEQISFIPGEPRANSELLIAVSSRHPNRYPKLAGTEKTTFDRERDGQLGKVWEWKIQLTYPGDHEYTFYVDSTIPCKTIKFRVRSALATSTPEPADLSADNGDNSGGSDNSDNGSDNSDNSDNTDATTIAATQTAISATQTAIAASP